MWNILLGSSVNGVVAIDSNEIIQEVNDTALKLLGWQRSTVLGMKIKDLINWPDLLQAVSQRTPLIGRVTSLADVTIAADYFPWTDAHEGCGAVAVFHSVSGQDGVSQERDRFAELYHQLQAVIDSSYDGFLITDGAGKILQVNKGYERIRGLNKEQVVGKSFNELIAEGLYSYSLVDEVLRDGATVSVMLSPNNNHVLFTATPVLGEDLEIVKIVLNVRDMTELTQLRYQLEDAKVQSRRYQDELSELRAQNLKTSGVVGVSPAMNKVWDLALQVAKVDSTVLITGESGVGKEVVAKVIHRHSSRIDESFIKVNCGAIPETLMESELFGYEPGAFTGTSKGGKPGLLELADNGTFLLDEIGDLALSLQVKLLRAIQEKEIVRVGGVKPRRINVRIIAATNHDLEEMVNQGLFRKDLFFRLNVVPIHVPALRERQDDILPLIYYFRNHFNQKYHLKKEFAPEIMEFLLDYAWPGNVRELENMVERLMVTASKDLITVDNLPSKLLENKIEGPFVRVKGVQPLRDVLEQAEHQLIREALSRYSSPDKAAEVLGINRATMFRKLKKMRQDTE